MNLDFKNKTVEIIFVIVASTIFALLGIYYIPVLMFLYPVLFIIMGVRLGINYAIISLFISTLSIGLMVDIISGVCLFIAFAPLSIAIIYTIKNRKKATEVLFISTLVFLASVLVVIGIMRVMADISIIDMMKESFSEILNSQLEMLKELELPNYQILKAKYEIKDKFSLLLAILPSIVMIFCLVTAYLNYLIASLSLRKLGYAVVFIPRFSRFRLPKNVLFGIATMFLVTFLLKYLNFFNFDTVFVNLVMLATFVFFIQGLSVLDYKLIQRKARTFTRIFIFLIIVLFVSVLGNPVAIFGFLDVIFDFRKFRHSA